LKPRENAGARAQTFVYPKQKHRESVEGNPSTRSKRNTITSRPGGDCFPLLTAGSRRQGLRNHNPALRIDEAVTVYSGQVVIASEPEFAVQRGLHHRDIATVHHTVGIDVAGIDHSELNEFAELPDAVVRTHADRLNEELRGSADDFNGAVLR